MFKEHVLLYLRLPSSRRAKLGMVNDRRTKWRGGSRRLVTDLKKDREKVVLNQ